MFEQFYHTRCRAEESVIGQEEFSVRAASLSAEQIMARRLHLELADLAIYELPTSSRNRMPGSDDNAVGRPIRLARVKMRSGTEAVVHSVVRADPQRVYFSHIILPRDGTPSLPASECVALWGLQSTWGSKTGCVSAEPQGLDISRSKQLPQWVPPGGEMPPIMSPDAVKCFLNGEPVAIPSAHASLDISPARMRDDENKRTRRLLLENILAAFLSGRKVVLVAEPGLAALLVYSVTLLLPRRLTDSVTFSTYEPPGRISSKQFDFVNTIGDLSAGFFGLTSTAGGAVLFETFRLNEPQAFATHGAVSSYASHAVSRLQQNDLSDLGNLWRTISLVVGEENLTRSSFLSAWEMIERLWRIDEEPLSNSELGAYVARPQWRELLFKSPQGRFQAVHLAIRGEGTVPPWWPDSPEDESNRRLFSPHLPHFQEQMIAAIVEELEERDNSSAHIETANFCLGKLLPGLTDNELTPQVAFTRIVDRLENGDDGKKLANRLPWTTRRAILKLLAKQSRHLSPQQQSFIRRSQWLDMTSIDELQAIQSEDIPAAWKAKAIAMFIASNDRCEAVIAKLLLNEQTLFNDTFGLLTEALSDSPVRLKKTVASLFNAIPSAVERVRLCYALFKTGLLSRSPELKYCFEKFICVLADGNSPWHRFFADQRDLNELIDAIGVRTETAARFWAACCRNLDDSCLDVSSELHRVLLGLMRADDEGKLHFPSNGTNWSQILEHWRRVRTALYDRLPVGEEWYALRWSLKALGIESPAVLGCLLRSAVTKGQVVEPGEIVQCANVLLPRGTSICELASVLTKSTQSLPDESRSQLQAVLLSEACQDTCEHYEQILCDTTALGLPPTVEASLLEKRNALLQRARDARLDASKKTRFKDCVVCYGLPGGLVAIALVVFGCMALWSPRSILGPVGFAALCLLLVGGFAIAFFQSSVIYKIRTGQSDGFGDKPDSLRTRRNLRGSSPPRHQSANNLNDARRPPA